MQIKNQKIVEVFYIFPSRDENTKFKNIFPMNRERNNEKYGVFDHLGKIVFLYINFTVIKNFDLLYLILR